MRGGAFLNGKEGRVGFRKTLLLAKGRRRDSKKAFFNGKEGRVSFRKSYLSLIPCNYNSNKKVNVKAS